MRGGALEGEQPHHGHSCQQVVEEFDEADPAIRDGLTKAQEIAAEKMKPLMGGLGKLGL